MITLKTIKSVNYTMCYLLSEKYGFHNNDIDYKSIPPFGGICFLFLEDLLQLPPVVPGLDCAVS